MWISSWFGYESVMPLFKSKTWWKYLQLKTWVLMLWTNLSKMTLKLLGGNILQLLSLKRVLIYFKSFINHLKKYLKFKKNFLQTVIFKFKTFYFKFKNRFLSIFAPLYLVKPLYSKTKKNIFHRRLLSNFGSSRTWLH